MVVQGGDGEVSSKGVWVYVCVRICICGKIIENVPSSLAGLFVGFFVLFCFYLNVCYFSS